MRIATRTELLNAIIRRRSYKSYLEIGVCDIRWNFANVDCIAKLGVDPTPRDPKGIDHLVDSDSFFAENHRRFDIIFIDGLHEEAQVDRDIQNALAVLEPGGVIVLHDCLPPNEWEQRPYSEYREGESCYGTAWKSAYKYFAQSPYRCFVLDTDCGCGIIDTARPAAVASIPVQGPLIYTSDFPAFKAQWSLGVGDFERYLFRRCEKAVATLNLYGDWMPENVRASQRAAAKRWDADYIEITRPMFGWRDPFVEKLYIDRHVCAYDRAVYFDRDVVVRADCPSLFDLVPPDAIGAVSSEQEGHNLLFHIQPRMDQLCQLIGVAMDYTTEYINSGVLVFSPRLHKPAFDAARYLHGITWDRSWPVYDQGCLGLGIKWSETPLHLLPPEFNRCGARLWDHWTSKMDSYIWHFCGKKTWDAMQNTEWQ